MFQSNIFRRISSGRSYTPCDRCCCLALVFFLPSGVLLLTTLAVYHPYKQAAGFIPARCSIVESFPGRNAYEKVCMRLRVAYEDPRNRESNASADLDQGRNFGYLNPDETKITASGWCYPDRRCSDNKSCTYDCLFNPDNKRQIIERRKFTLSIVIHSLFWPSFALLVLLLCSLYYFLIHKKSLDDVIDDGNSIYLKVFLKLKRKITQADLDDALWMSVIRGYETCAHTLLSHGARSNVSAPENITPYTWSSYNGSSCASEILLDGCDSGDDAKDSDASVAGDIDAEDNDDKSLDVTDKDVTDKDVRYKTIFSVPDTNIEMTEKYIINQIIAEKNAVDDIKTDMNVSDTNITDTVVSDKDDIVTGSRSSAIVYLKYLLLRVQQSFQHTVTIPDNH
jgi:hypothetical protein